MFKAPQAEAFAREAGQLCKADLATDMVRELTELQGTMGGIYAREDGRPEEVWKAIYFHYLPVGVEATAPPTKEQLGKAAMTWAAVSLADKLDTVISMFAAGERPTGSRDPYGLRRAAQGIVRILVDLPELTGLDLAIDAGRLVAFAGASTGQARTRRSGHSCVDRVRFVLEQRGYDPRNVRAVTHGDHGARQPAGREAKARDASGVHGVRRLQAAGGPVQARAQHREEPRRRPRRILAAQLTEPAEIALAKEVDRIAPLVEAAVASGSGYRQAFAEAAKAGPAVAKFFDDVMVMTDDAKLRDARLRLLRRLEGLDPSARRCF